MHIKINLINGAYSQLRISGLTVQSTPEDDELALGRLESMMSEFFGRNICVNYNFEATPDVNSLTNVDRMYWFALETNLATRLLTDFGKEVPVSLLAYQQAGFSFLASSTAIVRPVQHPSRQPRGAGNTLRYNRWSHYYRPQVEVPQECASVVMWLDDIDDFEESFESYLNDSETIASYTLTADTGLTIVSESLASPVVSYRVKAEGSTIEGDGFLQVKIIGTTSTGRIETRFINFQVTDTTG